MALSTVQIAVTGAGNATLATAVSNYNTAIATAIATAYAVNIMNPQSLKVAPSQMIFDGTDYVVSGSIQYTTGG